MHHRFLVPDDSGTFIASFYRVTYENFALLYAIITAILDDFYNASALAGWVNFKSVWIERETYLDRAKRMAIIENYQI